MRTSIFLIAISIMLNGCGPSYKILKSDMANEFSMSDYPTFGFFEVDVKGDTLPEAFEQNLAVIKQAIRRNLEGKGLKEVLEPALKVNIGITVLEKIQTRQTNFQNDGRPLYMGQRRYSWKSKEVEVGRYREGTLLIHFVDSATSNLVWQGGSEGILPAENDNLRKNVSKAIDDIFSDVK
jgi:hypothetical protein